MKSMSNFSERLNELMFDNFIKPNNLANAIDVSERTIYCWKNGKQQIYLNNLIKLCNYLNCSVDYMAGRSDVLEPAYLQLPVKFNVAIRKIMQRKKISSYRLRKFTRFDGSYFARWDKGQQPNLSTLTELADFLDCSLDELVGKEKL